MADDPSIINDKVDTKDATEQSPGQDEVTKEATPSASTTAEIVETAENRTWIGTNLTASGSEKKGFSSDHKGASPISHNHRVLRHPKEVGVCNTG